MDKLRRDEDEAILRTSSLKGIGPFIDPLGLLRVRGRIQNANLNYETKHPIIIPDCHIATLLIRFHHILDKHAGVDSLITNLREKYHIIGVSRSAKKVVKYCLSCQRQDARACNQEGAPLPGDRVQRAAPFSVTGIDYAGPLFCKGSKNRFYILLFTCGVISHTFGSRGFYEFS